MDPVKQALEDYFPLEIADSQAGFMGMNPVSLVLVYGYEDYEPRVWIWAKHKL